jgi:hypothetical protein
MCLKLLTSASHTGQWVTTPEITGQDPILAINGPVSAP